jgi:hypothetical protein
LTGARPLLRLHFYYGCNFYYGCTVIASPLVIVKWSGAVLQA